MSPEIKSYGSGYAVFRGCELESTHTSFHEALASLPEAEAKVISDRIDAEREEAIRLSALQDKLGPDLGVVIYPEYGPDGNT